MPVARIVMIDSWEFWIAERHGDWYISVPDCGGQMDACPRVPEQLAWAERVFAGLPELAQVWPTSWQFKESALPAVERLLREHGARGPFPTDP